MRICEGCGGNEFFTFNGCIKCKACKTRVPFQSKQERFRQDQRRYKEKYRQTHRPEIAAMAARHDAGKLKATPRWANRFFITEIYRLAQARSKLLGFLWHVDHIVPLRSEIVCGLHVENNLAVIPATINQRKGNSVWPDMP